MMPMVVHRHETHSLRPDESSRDRFGLDNIVGSVDQDPSVAKQGKSLPIIDLQTNKESASA